eukprot:scaffold22598_cov55-Phaeocystis_antarctica.AAC.2
MPGMIAPPRDAEDGRVVEIAAEFGRRGPKRVPCAACAHAPRRGRLLLVGLAHELAQQHAVGHVLEHGALRWAGPARERAMVAAALAAAAWASASAAVSASAAGTAVAFGGGFGGSLGFGDIQGRPRPRNPEALHQAFTGLYIQVLQHRLD